MKDAKSTLRLCALQGALHFVLGTKYQGLFQPDGACIDGKWRAIVRFDEAHGFFHKDIISPTGEQRKTAQPVLDKKLALTEAIEDIKRHWRSYRKAYEDKYHGKK